MKAVSLKAGMRSDDQNAATGQEQAEHRFSNCEEQGLHTIFQRLTTEV